MNEYDQDEQDDLSSSNSFRARSNTWPLNRPDLTVPSSSVCIDETLPEIELEDDDLFTTNENWATGLVENQDIMSWDPILYAQNQQQQSQQPATIHHHHHQQQHQHHHHQQQQPQPQSQQQPHQPQQRHHQHHHHQQQAQHHPVNQHHHHHHHQQQQPPPLITQGHHRHHSIHVHNQQSHPHQHHHRQDLHQDSQNDPFLDVVPNNSNNVLLTPHGVIHVNQHQSQLQQRLSPTQHQTHTQHQTLSSVHCIDQDESNEYHIQQMHHLSLDSSHPPQPHESSQQDHYAPTLSSMCIRNPSSNLNNDTSYNITADHQDQNNHHLQPLSSASYDIDQQAEYELKAQHDEALASHVEHQNISQQTHHHHHHPQMIDIHHHHPHHQPSHHQIQTTSSSLDNHSGTQMLSSSLSTSGIGLSGDLEDLDYNHTIDSSFLQSNPLGDNPQKPQTAKAQSADEAKQSDSTSNLKTKLNAPRRNAWGNMSYADLISQAINSTSDKRLTLSQIYDWMVQNVPYFKDKGDSNSSAGWKNSVRHNLSLHSRFKRLQNEGTGKSSWWTINPEANVGKCARRRAASMESSKYEKKRGRAKKKAEAIRQGLISYPSLTNSSLNSSTTALGQQDSQAQFKNSSQTSQKSEESQQQQPQPEAQSQQPEPQTQPQQQPEPEPQTQPQQQPQSQTQQHFQQQPQLQSQSQPQQQPEPQPQPQHQPESQPQQQFQQQPQLQPQSQPHFNLIAAHSLMNMNIAISHSEIL